jgi:hypothetical protein
MKSQFGISFLFLFSFLAENTLKERRVEGKEKKKSFSLRARE